MSLEAIGVKPDGTEVIRAQHNAAGGRPNRFEVLFQRIGHGEPANVVYEIDSFVAGRQDYEAARARRAQELAARQEESSSRV